MKSLNGGAAVAVWSALAIGGSAVAQEADCNVNGIPDATEIAQGLADDCNANGIPDACEYAGVMLEAEQSGFGNGSPLIATFTEVELSLTDVRLDVAVRADLDSVGEFVQVRVGGSVIATLWVTGGQACPSEVQSQTVLIPAATFNASIANGTVVISLEPSGVVSVKECPSSFASVAAEYVSDVLPADCLGNGAWEGCDISADPSLDCDGNGLIDSCEIDDDPSLDCDGNGILDACDLAADPLLDCDANGTLDECDIAAAPSLDCDSNGELDACEIAAGTAADCDLNGVPDACDTDCDSDGVPDACAIASGNAADCNGNGLPDLCEVQPGQYFDLDCDSNGVPDDCEIVLDPSLDKNGDRVLDSCQYARGDFNLDLSVDSSDLGVLLGLWGTVDPPLGDLTGDGMIDGADLGYLLLYWGTYSAPWGVVLDFAPLPSAVPDTALRAAIAATGLPWRVRHSDSGLEMLLVPPASFMMGCSATQAVGCNSDELPVHEVTLTAPFYLSRYEVTQAQWTAAMGHNPSYFQSASEHVPPTQIPQRPVEQVSWLMAQNYAHATTLRLPTEAEWELACRAGTDTLFNNGTDNPTTAASLGWNSDTSNSQTHPVGQLAPNALGFFDMHGNVWEHTNDWYDSSYYTRSPSIDPTGPLLGGSHTIRGGSWLNAPLLTRASLRTAASLGFAVSTIGLRPARSITGAQTESCNDGLDNDGDTLVDCDDLDCIVTSSCLPNDECEGATVILPGLSTIHNLYATTGMPQPPATVCTFFNNSTIFSDVWYRYVASHDGIATVSFCPAAKAVATFDTKLAVWRGHACDNLDFEACSDDACGLPSEVQFTTIAGETYYIQIGAYGSEQGGVATVSIAHSPF